MRPLKLFKSLDELFGVISINVKRLCPRGHEALKAANDFMSALVFSLGSFGASGNIDPESPRPAARRFGSLIFH